VLPSPEKLQVVRGAKKKTGDRSPLSVREQWVRGRRYIVCYNGGQARKDAAGRAAILELLKEKLKNGDKSLVGNKGYRRYLKSAGKEHFTIDEAKLAAEQRFDGMWVASHQHGVCCRRGSAEIQAAMDGGIHLPFGQEPSGDPPDLSQS
jgi:hypothetical protein